MRPVFIINSHGNGATVREGVVTCTPWSYPSTRHVLTLINISNQSPCCLSTCEPNFRWTREKQNWALTQASGTPEARPQRPKRSRGAQEQPNPDTQKQMLLTLSRLALKHDLEIRELQAATFRTMLVKYDEPLVQASKAATGLFVTISKEGQRPMGEPHVYARAAIMTAYGPSTLLRREAECGGIHVQREFTADSPAERQLEPVQKNISEGLGQVAGPSCA